MPYTTNVAGTTITAAWGNANVRDQVVTPFASPAARASAITAPIEGMLAYLQDVDLFTWYDGAAWVAMPARTVVRKTADEAVASSTVLQNDDALLWPVKANAVYELDMVLHYSADTAGDLKAGWTYPVGLTMIWAHMAWGTTSAFTASGSQTETSTPAYGGLGAGIGIPVFISGVVTVGANAGTLQLQWAQNVSSATGTTVAAGSRGALTRIA